MMDINVFFEVRGTARVNTPTLDLWGCVTGTGLGHTSRGRQFTPMKPRLYFLICVYSGISSALTSPSPTRHRLVLALQEIKHYLNLNVQKIKCVEAHREQHSRNPKHDDVWFFCLLALHSLWSVTGFPPISSSPIHCFSSSKLFCVSAPLLLLFFGSSSQRIFTPQARRHRENTKLKITPHL